MAREGLRRARDCGKIANAQLGRLIPSLRLKRQKHCQARRVRENGEEFRDLTNALHSGKSVQSVSHGVDVNDVNLTTVRSQLLFELFAAIIDCEPVLRGPPAAGNM